MRLRILLLLLPLLLAACSGDDPAGPADDAAGIYTLVEVNGEPLPHIINPPSGTLRITAGSMWLMEDGTFGEQVTFRIETDNGPFDETEINVGTWTRSGSGLQFTTQRPNLSYTNVSLAGGTLRYTATGIFSFDLTLERQE